MGGDVAACLCNVTAIANASCVRIKDNIALVGSYDGALRPSIEVEK